MVLYLCQTPANSCPTLLFLSLDCRYLKYLITTVLFMFLIHVVLLLTVCLDFASVVRVLDSY